MIVGIHIDPDRRDREDNERFTSILLHNGIPFKWLDANAVEFWDEVAKVNLFIFHWTGTTRQHQIAPAILPVIEYTMGIPCYPAMKTWWFYDDKIREYYILTQNSFPAIPTWIFWEKEAALKWMEQATFPVVFKLRRGSSSVNVTLIRDKREARKFINKMFGRGITSERLRGSIDTRRKDLGFYGLWYRNMADLYRILKRQPISNYEETHKNYILFQRYLPDNQFDTRITIIGERAFLFRRFVRPFDFRASGSGNIDWNQDEVDPRCIKLAFEISRRLGSQSMAYDILYDENREPQIGEISYTFVDWLVWKCPGYWDESMNWHEGQLWPQYCILVDALKRSDLKQPALYPTTSI